MKNYNIKPNTYNILIQHIWLRLKNIYEVKINYYLFD